MKTVVIESPFEGGTPREADNVAYLHRCLLDSLRRGEAPFASHALYPSVLDDTVPNQRTLGIEAGFAIAVRLDAWVLYLDRGVTRGMLLGFERALQRRVDLPTLRATTLFRAFGASMERNSSGQAREVDPWDAMVEFPQLFRVAASVHPGLAEQWKIVHDGG